MIDSNLIPMYPDIAEHGGLLPAVRKAFVGDSALEIQGFGTGAHYAYLAFGPRSADVYLGAESRLFRFGLCEAGKAQASGEATSFEELIGALRSWLLKRSSVSDLVSAHPFCGRWRGTNQQPALDAVRRFGVHIERPGRGASEV
jgi:hypothetical protein